MRALTGLVHMDTCTGVVVSYNIFFTCSSTTNMATVCPVKQMTRPKKKRNKEEKKLEEEISVLIT